MQSHTRRKRKIKLLAAFFFGLILFVTFFSNTFQQLTYPKVKTITPIFQQLIYPIEGEGKLTPLKIDSIYDGTGWKVAQIEVETGDYVKKGQKLIEFDTTIARHSLLDEEASYKKLSYRRQASCVKKKCTLPHCYTPPPNRSPTTSR